MKITCPNCGISYQIQEDSVGSEGRKVRCSRCNTQWNLSADDGVPPEEESKLEPNFDPTLEDGESDEDPEDFVDAKSELGSEKPFAEPDDPPEPDEEPTGRAVKVKKRGRRANMKMPRIPRMHSVRMTSNKRTMLGVVTLAASLAICFSTIVFRNGIVDKFPDLASLYKLVGFEVNLRKLEFGDLRVFRELEGGEPVLVLEGAIENPNRNLVVVPAIRFALRNEDAQEIYAWILEPRVAKLDAGQSARFRTRLVSPPEMASDVQLRFTERRKRQASLQ